MTVYFFLLVFPFITLIFSRGLYPYDEKSYRHLFLYVSFGGLLLISGLRSIDVGGDLNEYLPEFELMTSRSYVSTLSDIFELKGREFGFALFEKTIGMICLNNTFYLISTSCLFLSIIMFAIYRYSTNIFLSVLIFILYSYVDSFNIIRQSIAVAICLYSFNSIKERNLKIFLLFLLLAFSFHKSAIFFLPAYFVYGKYLNVKFAIIITTASLFFSFIISGSGLADILNLYFSSFNYNEDYLNETSSGLSKMSFLELSVTYYGVYLYKRCNLKDCNFSFFIYMLLIGTIIHFFSPIFTLISRIAFYYFSYCILFIPKMFMYMGKIEKVFAFYIVLILFGFVYFSGLIKNTQGIVPYSFCF